jgi:hypothetical protein
VLLLTWRRIRDFIPNAHLPYPLYHWLGLLAAAIYLFSREPLCFEMDIRPEGICGFLLSMNLYFLIQFTACCFLKSRRTATVTYGIAVVFSSILLASVKPSFRLTAIVALLPVVMFLFRKGWFRQKVALAGGAAVSAVLLLLPEHFLSRNDEMSKTFVAQLHREFGTNISALCNFYWFYYWRIWLHGPLRVAKKIMREMAIFFARKCPAYRLGKFLSLTGEYKISLSSLGSESYRKILTAYPPAMDFMNRTEALARAAPIVEQSAIIRRLLGILAVTYRPLLLIALALSVAVFLHEGTRRRLGWLAAIVLFAYSYNAAKCLEVAVVQSLENPRYLAVQMFFTTLAQFLAILLVLEVLVRSRTLIRGQASRAKDLPAGAHIA